jgi:hypothetical protein
MTTHAHREGHLTFYVQGAFSSMQVNNQPFVLDPYSAVAVNPWEPHSFCPGDRDHGTLFLVLYIKPIWFLETARSAQSWLRFGRNRIDVAGQIQRSVTMIVSLLLEGEESDLFDGYLYELTQESFDQSWQWMPDGTAQLPCQSRFTDFRVRKSMRLMSEKLGETFELDDVAKEA